MGVRIRWSIPLFALVCIVLGACGQPMAVNRGTAIPASSSGPTAQIVHATQVAVPTEKPSQVVPVEEIAPTAEPAPVPAAVKVLDWSNISELQGSTFEFITSTHVPGNTQPFAGWVSVMDLFNSGQEQPKGTLAVYSDTDPQSYVSQGGDSMLIFVTCRDLDPRTGRSANNKRTLIFAVLKGSQQALVTPEIITVHSFSYQGDARVDRGEQFKLLGNQGHQDGELWPVEGAFVLHLVNGQTLVYNYVAGLNIHYTDDYPISPYDVLDTKTKYAEQLQALLK